MIDENKIRSGLSWQAISTGGQVAIQMLVLAVLARLLDPVDFGLMAAANVFVNLAQLLAEAGAGPAIVQRKIIDRRFIGVALAVSALIGVFLLVVQWLAANSLADFFNMPELAGILPVLGLSFIFFSLARVPEAILQRKMKFAAIMKTNLASLILGYAAPALLLALLGFGVWALVAASVLQSLTRMLLLGIVTRDELSIRYESAAARELLEFGVGMVQIRFWNFLMLQGDRFIVAKTLGAEPLGGYSLAHQAATVPTRHVGDVFDKVFFPVLSRLQDNPKKFAETYLQLNKSAALSMFAIGCYLAANADLLVRILLGSQWQSIVPVVQILSLGAGFRLAGQLADAANRSLGLLRKAAQRKLGLAVVLLAAVVVAVPWGIEGVGAAVVMVQLLGTFVLSALAAGACQLRKHINGLREIRYFLIWGSAIIALNVSAFFVASAGQLTAWVALAFSGIANALVVLVLVRPLLADRTAMVKQTEQRGQG